MREKRERGEVFVTCWLLLPCAVSCRGDKFNKSGICRITRNVPSAVCHYFFGQNFSGICSFDLQGPVGVECWCKTSTQLLVVANWDINIPLEFPLLLGICSGMIRVLHAQSPLYSYFSVHFLSFIILKIPLLCTSHSPNSENPVFVFVCF